MLILTYWQRSKVENKVCKWTGGLGKCSYTSMDITFIEQCMFPLYSLPYNELFSLGANFSDW